MKSWVFGSEYWVYMIGDGGVNTRNIRRFRRARGGLKAPNPETVATNRLYCFSKPMVRRVMGKTT